MAFVVIMLLADVEVVLVVVLVALTVVVMVPAIVVVVLGDVVLNSDVFCGTTIDVVSFSSLVIMGLMLTPRNSNLLS